MQLGDLIHLRQGAKFLQEHVQTTKFVRGDGVQQRPQLGQVVLHPKEK